MSAARVLCVKADGRHVEFQTYADPIEAERVAARLRELGCDARVEFLEVVDARRPSVGEKR